MTEKEWYEIITYLSEHNLIERIHIGGEWNIDCWRLIGTKWHFNKIDEYISFDEDGVPGRIDWFYYSCDEDGMVRIFDKPFSYVFEHLPKEIAAKLIWKMDLFCQYDSPPRRSFYGFRIF